MKYCKQCNAKTERYTDKYTKCKPCQRRRARKYYAKNKKKIWTPEYRAKDRKRKLAHKESNIKRYLKENGDYCKLCNKKYPFYIYEMHHVDPKDKESGIFWYQPWKSIERELRKCTMLCANCHKEVHHERDSAS